MADVHLEIKDRLVNEVQTSIKDWKNENYKKQMVGGCKEARSFEDDFKRVSFIPIFNDFSIYKLQLILCIAISLILDLVGHRFAMK